MSQSASPGEPVKGVSRALDSEGVGMGRENLHL